MNKTLVATLVLGLTGCASSGYKSSYMQCREEMSSLYNTMSLDQYNNLSNKRAANGLLVLAVITNALSEKRAEEMESICNDEYIAGLLSKMNTPEGLNNEDIEALVQHSQHSR